MAARLRRASSRRCKVHGGARRCKHLNPNPNPNPYPNPIPNPSPNLSPNPYPNQVGQPVRRLANRLIGKLYSHPRRRTEWGVMREKMATAAVS